MSGGVAFLDLATVTGWAVYEPPVAVTFGVVRIAPAGSGDGFFFASLADWLERFLAEFSPACLTYESPILSKDGRRTSFATARRLMGMGCFAEYVAHRRGVPRIYESKRQTIVKHFCGKVARTGAEQKADVRFRCQGLGIAVHGDDDADALAGLDHSLAALYQLSRGMVPGLPSGLACDFDYTGVGFCNASEPRFRPEPPAEAA